MLQDRKQGLVSAFTTRFGRPPALIAEAPGRVNLIGEHTDYNGGFVLPVAIDRTTLVAASAAREAASRVWSIDLAAESRFLAGRPDRDAKEPWSDYVRGVAWAMARSRHRLRQLDLAIQSSVPIGAGLSSSAALEVATAAAFAKAGSLALTPRELALLAHDAEVGFVGVPCGIMDQFVACLGVEDHALLIDCRSHDVEPVPLGLKAAGLALVVVDSGVPRRLAQSAYRERREQCEAAVRLLNPLLPNRAATLRDVTPEDLCTHGSGLPPVLLKRVRHVVTENQRVLRCVRALRQRRLEEVGTLLAESDLLVELAWRAPGVVGARLTGAGFGGCTVNLVRVDAVEGFRLQVAEEYRRRTGMEARTYLCQATHGVRVETVS